MAKILLLVLVGIVFVVDNPAHGQMVLCSTPMEDDCSSTEFFSCSLILCVTNDDPDPEAPPVICDDDSQEEVVQVDGEGNPKKYHMGLEVVTEPGIDGNTEWINSEVVCTKSRDCKHGDHCELSQGSFWCKSDTMLAWTENKDLFYNPVPNTGCRVIEDE